MADTTIELTDEERTIDTIKSRTGLAKSFLKRHFDEGQLQEIKGQTKSPAITKLMYIFGAGGALIPVIDQLTGATSTQMGTPWIIGSVFAGSMSILFGSIRDSANKGIATKLTAKAQYPKNYTPKMLKPPEND